MPFKITAFVNLHKCLSWPILRRQRFRTIKLTTGMMIARYSVETTPGIRFTYNL
jgi:hypothetical protein